MSAECDHYVIIHNSPILNIEFPVGWCYFSPICYFFWIFDSLLLGLGFPHSILKQNYIHESQKAGSVNPWGISNSPQQAEEIENMIGAEWGGNPCTDLPVNDACQFHEVKTARERRVLYLLDPVNSWLGSVLTLRAPRSHIRLPMDAALCASTEILDLQRISVQSFSGH